MTERERIGVLEERIVQTQTSLVLAWLAILSLVVFAGYLWERTS